jgi:hypothetical protein
MWSLFLDVGDPQGLRLNLLHASHGVYENNVPVLLKLLRASLVLGTGRVELSVELACSQI